MRAYTKPERSILRDVDVSSRPLPRYPPSTQFPPVGPEFCSPPPNPLVRPLRGPNWASPEAVRTSIARRAAFFMRTDFISLAQAGEERLATNRGKRSR